jgi:hypothetical protein
MIFRQVQACRRIIALHTIFLYCSWQLIWWLLFVRLVLTSSSHSLGVPLPLLLYPRGVKLQGRYPSWLQHDSYSDSISTCLFYTYFYRYNYLCHWEHIMVLWNHLDGGPSHSGPLLGPFESVWGGTPGTNPHH